MSKSVYLGTYVYVFMVSSDLLSIELTLVKRCKHQTALPKICHVSQRKHSLMKYIPNFFMYARLKIITMS